MVEKVKWRLIVDGRMPAAMNMAIDEALFRLCGSCYAGTFPVLRFYQWENPTLSFGSSQNIARAVDIEYCRKAGFNVVRRPTGGRAVLHDDEVTYSVVAPVNGMLGNSIQETYRLISEGIIRGLSRLGVKADTEGKAGESRGDRLTYVPCFASSTKYEIAFNGKKIVGSAQRRNNRSFLQHGSILMNFNSVALMKAIGAGGDGDNPSNYMTSISEVLRKEVDFNETVESLIKGFRDAFHIDLVEMPQTEGEKEAAQFLYNTKYKSELWNHCR
jgi:lipoate-protein ligase A